MIKDFLSDRTNLTVLQCLLYVLMGYITATHLELVQQIIMFVIVFVLQLTTHIKAIADGMVYNQLMNDNKDFKKFIEKIKKNKLGDK